MQLIKSLTITLLLITSSCSFIMGSSETIDNSVQEKSTAELTLSNNSKYQTAYFASGCFWCVEAVFESVKGVNEVVSGYAGGTEKNPTYEQVGRGLTTHAETVEVQYDPNIVSFETLVQVFFGSHDPSTLNRQGPDKGAQYRSIAFYKNDTEKQVIADYIKLLEEGKTYGNARVTTQVVPFKKFYKAESYHQDYEKNHPNNPYILGVSIPRLNKFKSLFPHLLKDNTAH